MNNTLRVRSVSRDPMKMTPQMLEEAMERYHL